MLNSNYLNSLRRRAFLTFNRILIVAGVLAFAAGCGSTSPYYQQKPSEVKAKIKRVLYLPVFLGANFFPTALIGKAPAGYDKKYADAIAKAVAAKAPDFDHVIKAVLRANEHFEYVEGTQQDILEAKPTQTRSEFFLQDGGQRQMEWLHNSEYVLSPESIARLSVKYNVDAVFYGYFQVKKVWTSVSTGRDMNYATGQSRTRYKIVPSDTIVYLPVMVDKTGATVYGGVRYGIPGQSQFVMNENGDKIAYMSSTKGETEKGFSPLPIGAVLRGIDGLTKEKILEIVNRHCGSFILAECGSLSGF
jgi:hypothetical protein